MVTKAVYYDEQYDSGWITQPIAQRIALYLEQRGFTILNASELRAFMLDVLQNRIDDPIVVFAMDKAPDTVLDDNDASCLIRQFLDAGGRILWIGDIPFWHIGKNKKAKLSEEETTKAKDYYINGAYMAVLGINPVVRTASSQVVKITRDGRRLD